MAFVPNPGDPPRQRMVDKLVAAGWIKSAIWKSEPEPSDPHAGRFAIQWTEQGQARMMMFLSLVQEVENDSSRICNDELEWFRAFAELAVISSFPRDTGRGGNRPR